MCIRDRRELVRERVDELRATLRRQVYRALNHRKQLRQGTADPDCPDCAVDADAITSRFLAQLPALRHALSADVRAAFDGDPAATGADEIVVCYPGFAAVTTYRLAHALLREGDVVSGAYLAIEPGAEESVYAKLHARPRVLGMVANASAVRSFYATIGEFVLFYNLVATLLAASIGFGVVYNSARIALSERGRELASLRVLGFTRGEIAYILLGELALLTLAAIPVGILVGIGLIGVLVLAFSSDLYRLPVVLAPDNIALGATVVVASALVSGLILWRRLGRLDLVAVLKTRE